VPRFDEKWPPVCDDRLDDELAQLGRELLELEARQPAHVGGDVDLIEEFGHQRCPPGRPEGGVAPTGGSERRKRGIS
jgi:hypothetical protein